jgi:DNA-binding NarL/FixJ family response regulator
MTDDNTRRSARAMRLDVGSSWHQTLLVLRGWTSLRWSAGEHQRISLLRRLDANGPYGLTTNEFELVRAVAGGCAVKQAASDLGLRWGAARAAASRALQKLGLRTCAQLPAFWHGLSGAVSASRAGDGTELLVFESRLAGHSLLPGMTFAEREVLHAVLLGHDHQQIAIQRRTSPRTVANQLASLFRKFGVSSKAELAARALAADAARAHFTARGASLETASACVHAAED